MKRFLLAALIALAAVPASAASVGVSIGFNQPGFHGDIHVGDYHRPHAIYHRPVAVYPAPVIVGYRPVYGHHGYRGYGHWKHSRHGRHCRH